MTEEIAGGEAPVIEPEVSVEKFITDPSGDVWGSALFYSLGKDAKATAEALTGAVKEFTEGREVMWRATPSIESEHHFDSQVTWFKGRARFAFR